MNYKGLTRLIYPKGYPPDNSACEGLFEKMKNEMFYAHSWQGVSLEELIYEIEEYYAMVLGQTNNNILRWDEPNGI